VRTYTYFPGEAIVLGGGFWHSTEPGWAPEPRAFLCFTFGTDREELWPSIAKTLDSYQSRILCRPGGQMQLTTLGKNLNFAYDNDKGSQIKAAAVPSVGLFSVEEVRGNAAECVRHFQSHGCCVVHDALPGLHCYMFAELIDRSLSPDHPDVCADERCPECRWNWNLPLTPPVSSMLFHLGRSLGSVLEQVVTRDALLCEVACIISDPGAPLQCLLDDACDRTGLVTIIIILQPITDVMNPLLVSSRPEDRASVPGDDAGFNIGCEEGTCMLTDERVVLSGGANVGGYRQRLFVATFAPPGSTPLRALHEEFAGRYYLRDYLPSDPPGGTARHGGSREEEGNHLQQERWQ